MADLTVQAVSLTGAVITPVAAAAGGDTFSNDGRTILRVVNGGASPITATVNSLVACNQGFDHDAAVTVAAGVTKDIGPFPVARFNNSSGKAAVTYSDVTSVTVAAIRV